MTINNQALIFESKVFTDILNENDSNTELVINSPTSAFIENKGRWLPLEKIPYDKINSFGVALASAASGEFNKKKPLLSAALPSGERVQLISPPVSQYYSLAIRKPSVVKISLDDYKKAGALDLAITTEGETGNTENNINTLIDKGDIYNLLIALIKARKTLVISGGTSSGKTTFFNAIAEHIDHSERLISIEDTPEIDLQQTNKLSLIAQRNSDRANFGTLLEACLRLRPDRILAAELRSADEALAFLQGANTGHPGSITTIHANSVSDAKDRLAIMLMQSGIGLDRDQILNYINSSIDCFVQMSRIETGERVVTEVGYKGRIAKR